MGRVGIRAKNGILHLLLLEGVKLLFFVLCYENCNKVHKNNETLSLSFLPFFISLMVFTRIIANLQRKNSI